MSSVRTYCIDGSNLVRSSGWEPGEERDARWLVEACAVLCRRLEDRLEIELFFDGRDRPFPGPGPSNLRVRFSREETADDLILDRVRSAKWSRAAAVTVVTGDSGLGRQAEEEGGKWQRVSHGTALESVVKGIERRFAR